MSEKKSRGEFELYMQQERKMKWYKRLWNVITGNKWRNKRWVLVKSTKGQNLEVKQVEKENR